MEYTDRLNKYKKEIESILLALYGKASLFSELEILLKKRFDQRSSSLKELDEYRLENPTWYIDSNMLGITMYTDLFAGSFKRNNNKNSIPKRTRNNIFTFDANLKNAKRHE